jgi:hypothetical protein
MPLLTNSRAEPLFGEEFDVLPVIDLDEREGQTTVGVVELEGLTESQEVFVEDASFVDVVNGQRDVRYTGNPSLAAYWKR